MSGNNVRHAVNKTQSRFYPNLHNVSFFSEVLGKKIKLKVSSRGIKTVEKNGGIDNYIIKVKTSELTEETKKLFCFLSKFRGFNFNYVVVNSTIFFNCFDTT